MLHGMYCQVFFQKAERKRLEKKRKEHDKQRKAAELKQSRQDAKMKRVAAKVAAKVAKDKDRELKRVAADAKRRMRPPVSCMFYSFDELSVSSVCVGICHFCAYWPCGVQGSFKFAKREHAQN